MQEQVLSKAEAFKGINALAMRGEIVVYGSTYMANFPFYELINKSYMENAVYNRSIAGMTIAEAKELLQICVLDIKPNKVFLHLGEKDFDAVGAAENYAAIVRQIHSELPQTNIYLIGIQNERASTFNKEIAALCNQKNIFYIHFSGADGSNYKHRFLELSCFFRNRRMNMAEAFVVGNL